MRFSLVPFEERILLDAAGAANVVNTYEAEHATDQAQQQAQQQQDHADNPGVVSGNNDAVDGRVLVVSSQVKDSALLSDAAKDGVTVITYDFNTSLADLSKEIADKLGGKEATSIGFAMMGADGQFAITADTMMFAMENASEFSLEVQDFWSSVGSMVKTGGSIDILSCDVGINVSGLQLLNQIDVLVQSANPDHDVTINISTDKTGASSLGGNWTLELSSMDGKMQAASIDAVDRYFDSSKISDWEGLLDAPYRVADINPGSASSNPTQITDFGSYVVYSATTADKGTEVWFTNRDTNQTFMLSDIAPNAASSTPHDFTVVGNNLYFVTGDSSKSQNLYSVDGTTLALTHISNPESGYTQYGDISAINGKLYYILTDSSTKYTGTTDKSVYELWSYDGTKSTQIFSGILNDTKPLSTSGIGGGPFTITTRVLSANDMISNGTDIFLSVIVGQKVVDSSGGASQVYQNELWSIDINTGELNRLAFYGDNIPTNGSPKDMINNIVVNGNIAYFVAQADFTNYNYKDVSQVWKSDGTKAWQVTNLTSYPGTFSANPSNLTVLDGNVYFTANTQAGGNADQLYVTDGTPVVILSNGNQTFDSKSGVALVTDFSNGSAFISNLTVMNDKLYFTANDGTNGNELWVTSGMDKSTGNWLFSSADGVAKLVSDINTGSASSNPSNLLVVGDKLYFAATNASGGRELWVSDGIPGGVTRQVADINIGTGSSNPGYLTLSGSKIFFSATDGSTGTELWSFDTNNAPVGANKTYNGTEDTTLNVTAASGVLQGASDPEGNTISAVLVGNGSKGTVTLNADGSFRYVPNANANGTDTFTYRVKDQYGALSAIYTATINIAAVNDAPVAQSGSATTAEDTPLSSSVNATDIDSATLTYSLVSGPTHGTLVFNANGTYTYTPTTNYSGTDSFSFRANDGSLNSNNATVNLTITPVNDAPVAASSSFTIAEDTPQYSGVVKATDVESPTLTYSLVSGPSHGTLTFNADGSYIYKPAANYNGSDSFTFRASDGSLYSNNGAVNITVTPVNDAPVANSANVTTAEDTSLLGNAVATDIDSPNLTYSLVSGPSHGTLTFNADGSYVYKPAANYNGSDSFTFRASDGSLSSNNGTVNITVTPVNDAPVANSANVTTAEDISLSGKAVATDIDSPNLTYSLVSGPSHGTLTFNADGTYVYKPAADYNGNDSFTFRASDGSLSSNNGAINITVTPVNDAPVVLPSTVTTLEDVPYNGQVVWTDPDSTNFTVTVVDQPQHGSLTMNNDGTYTYTPNHLYNGPDSFTVIVNDGQVDSAPQSIAITVGPVDNPPEVSSPSLITLEDSPINILPATLGTDVDSPSFTVNIVTPPAHGSLSVNPDGSVTYTPETNYNGTDSFRYTLNDGTSDSAAVGTVTLNVTPVNDAPVPSSPTLAVAEDGSLPISISQLGTDVDGDPLNIVITDPPAHGILTVQPDGSVVYQPNANFNGTDSFSYLVNDGTVDSVAGVANIVVTPVNDAPVAINPTIGGTEDVPVSITPAQLGTDVDGDPLAINIVNPPSHGTLQMEPDGSIKYIPDANYNGTDSFTYTVTDGAVNSNIGTVNLVIAPIDDVPVALNPTIGVQEDQPIDILVSQLGSDVDSSNLEIIIDTHPEHGTLQIEPDGSVKYIPDANYNGNDSFTYTITDGQNESSPGTVFLVVSPVNDEPTASNPTLGLAEDTQLIISAAQLGNDIDGDSLTVNIVQPPEYGSLTLNNDGTLTYTPNANFNGTDNFSYTVSDGKVSSDLGSAFITVTPVNDAPTASNPTLSVNEDNLLQILPSQLGNDVDGDALNINIITPPSNGTLIQNADGSITYQPGQDFNGTDSFSYTVNDGTTDSAVGIANIVVNPINDAPIATSPTVVLAEDSSLNLLPTDLGTDVDGDALHINIITPPQHGTLIQNADGSITYQPGQDFNGNDSFSYTVNDGTTDSPVGTVKLIVSPVNDAPEATSPTISLVEGTPITLPVDQLGTDIDGDSLTIIITQPPSHGTLISNPDGSITYIPNPDYSGSDNFSYTVTDGQLTSNEGTAHIVVNPVGGDVIITPPDNGGDGTFIIPPQDHSGGGDGVHSPNSDPADISKVTLGNPFATNFGDLSDHNIKFLSTDLLNKEPVNVDMNIANDGHPYQDGGTGDGGVSVKVIQEDAHVGSDHVFDAGGAGDSDLGKEGWIYPGDDLSRLLFFLGPITQKADYAAKSNLGNLLRTRKRNLFRYREKRKIKKFSDLIEFLGLADLSYKRKSKKAIQNENLNTIQRGTLEKNLDPDLFGEEFLNNYISELRALSNMEVDAKLFPIVEALAVELLTKYIAAQDLVEGTKIPFPVLKVSGHSTATEYTVSGVFTLGSSGIPIYLLTGKNLPPLLIFRGTKLGLKKVAEVRSIIENFNSKGPARLHYNNFLPTMKAFFEEWFDGAPKSKKFRLFGYSQGGVLGQRTLVDFPEYVQTSDKYPSIFFNSPGVEEDYYRKWSNFDEKHRPAAINYVTTGDVVSKIGTGFVGEIFEINPKVEKDILESHYGMKFLEEDWKLYRVDSEAESKSETRAMLNAIQASFLTTEVYKIASAGVEKLYARPDKGFSANKAIQAIETHGQVAQQAAQAVPKPAGIEFGLLGSSDVLNTAVFLGHVNYIDTSERSSAWPTDSVIDNNLLIQKKQPTKKAKMKLINSVTKPAIDAVGALDTTAIDYKRDAPLHRNEPTKDRLLDLNIEPNLYTQADMSAAAIAIIEDIRELIPDTEGTSYKILDAVKEEKKIDHTNL